MAKNYHFPGSPRFVDAAAEQLGCAEVAAGARRSEALAALANLCAQAAEADQAHVAGILEKAADFHNRLQVAALAASLMLDDVRNGRLQAPPPPVHDSCDPGRRTRRAPTKC